MKNLTPLSVSEWTKGDYQHAASLRHDGVTIEDLAKQIDAEIESVLEDGLGVVKAFGGRVGDGYQFAFDYYVAGPLCGPNLLLLFKNGECRRDQIFEVLALFGLNESDTWWICPAAV